MLAKKFFYVSLGILALALAYHLGAKNVNAQGGGKFMGISVEAANTFCTTAITESGDIYARSGVPYCTGAVGSELNWLEFGACPQEWVYLGNVLAGTAASSPSDGPSAKSGTLSSPRPNPFNPSTEIAFTLDAAGDVDLRIYGASGALVRTLVEQPQAAGRHVVTWDGLDARGATLASGTYFYQLRVNGQAVGSQKAVILR
ncbi:MAG: FlgD immunoglobulin-like domain containing protein [bacterium]